MPALALLPGDADRVLHNAAGLRIALTPHGALRRIDGADVMVNQYLGDAIDGAPSGLWLRRLHAGAIEVLPLLGPRSPLAWQDGEDARSAVAAARWQDLVVRLALRLADDRAAWFWHVRVTNAGPRPVRLDLVSAQDVGLARADAIRNNEYYLSHYIDLAPLTHRRVGTVLAARQNQAVDGRHPWALFGSLRRAIGFATDGLQFHGLALRLGALPHALHHDLPSRRLQHEHALVALQDEAVELAPGETVDFGRFAAVEPDHPEATGPQDIARVDALLACDAASPRHAESEVAEAPSAASLFARSRPLECLDPIADDLAAWFGPDRRHAEVEDGQLLSFFHGDDAHVVLRAKELRVMRPHGHLLHTGDAAVPEETALTSTVWMGGVFHSMLTQGHVGINRLLSTVRSWLGHFPSHGQRVFVRTAGEADAAWQLLGLPSAFEMRPAGCRWFYRHAGGVIEVRSGTGPGHALGLELIVHDGAPVQVLVTHRIALAGDDGCAPHALRWHVDAQGAVQLEMPVGSALAQRFPDGRFVIAPAPGTQFAAVAGDGRLFDDRASRGEPFVCIEAAATRRFGLRITGALLDEAPPPHALSQRIEAPRPLGPSTEAAQLADVLPWFTHDARIHYLAPRGLEQFTGGGWGTRDVCQGPVELLLALDRMAPLRDLLMRVFEAQNADGDWPQWFMFFARERTIRAGDSHGDIVLWPLVALGRYLSASRDASVLDVPVPFFDGERAPLRQHVQRALELVARRRIPGTTLVAYGHGDWNDSLQPADPTLREHLCSAWTVTLHHQALRTLARGLREAGCDDEALPLEQEAARVRTDFRRWLLRDGQVAGYALFDRDADIPPRLLMHPLDTLTGTHHSLLPLMHAVLEDLLTPQEARQQLALIRTHLWGPDGARLFDRPFDYRGGPQVLFQRAESSAFFGREIGLMYMHAHLRYAQALAHVGDARGLGEAIALAHPIALRERLPQATPRQANCYFTSSDAAFADRDEAAQRYAEIAAGRVALDGGWRVYSSGPGVFVGLIVRDRLGLRREGPRLVIDPVLEPAQDGLRVELTLGGLALQLCFRVGPRGSGPSALEVAGRTLAFERAVHPLRVGGAIVTMDALAQATAGGATRLTVVVP